MTRPIRLRQQVYEPDYLIVQDPGLLYADSVLEGLKPDGMVLVNSTKPREELPIPQEIKVITVPALRIALDVIGRPYFNVVMVGAFACASKLVNRDAVMEIIKRRYPGELGEKEAQATMEACEAIGECG